MLIMSLSRVFELVYNNNTELKVVLIMSLRAFLYTELSEAIKKKLAASLLSKKSARNNLAIGFRLF